MPSVRGLCHEHRWSVPRCLAARFVIGSWLAEAMSGFHRSRGAVPPRRRRTRVERLRSPQLRDAITHGSLSPVAVGGLPFRMVRLLVWGSKSTRVRHGRAGTAILGATRRCRDGRAQEARAPDASVGGSAERLPGLTNRAISSQGRAALRYARFVLEILVPNKRGAQASIEIYSSSLVRIADLR